MNIDLAHEIADALNQTANNRESQREALPIDPGERADERRIEKIAHELASLLRYW